MTNSKKVKEYLINSDNYAIVLAFEEYYIYLKQPSEVLYGKRFFIKFSKVYRKTPVSEYLFQ